MPVSIIKNTKYNLSTGVFLPEMYGKYTYIDSSVTTSYSLLKDDFILLVDTNNSSVTIDFGTNIPFENGKIIYVKDVGGNAASNLIQFNIPIDNASYQINNSYGGVMLLLTYSDFVSNPSQTWWIMSNFN